MPGPIVHGATLQAWHLRRLTTSPTMAARTRQRRVGGGRRDYIDIGATLYLARAVPGVTESLIFPHGHDTRAELSKR